MNTRYFLIIKMVHAFDHEKLPANVKKALSDVELICSTGPEWDLAPNTRINQGKKLILFEVHTDEVTFQELLDAHLPQFEIMAYKTEAWFTPDPEEPAEQIYSTKPNKAELIDWMADDYDEFGDPVRPTEVRLPYVSGAGGSGKWLTV